MGSTARLGLAGEVMGQALFRMRSEDVARLRKRPGPIPEGWTRVPPSLLRYADEQTIAGTAAVFTAIEAMSTTADQFEAWGVVSASRFLGRANLAVALRSFKAEGVWGTSPHLIPHFALHSASGSVSLALGCHGPNLGVGGGRYALADGFLTALTWLSTRVVPGVWLVLTGWTPELAPDPVAHTPHDGECQAQALALVNESDRPGRVVVRAVFGTDGRHCGEPPQDLAVLAQRLGGGITRSKQAIATDASGRLRIELDDSLDLPE